MRIQYSLFLVGLVSFSCGKKKEQTASVSAKLRSTGIKSLALDSLNVTQATSTTTLATMTGNVLELEYYKVPVRRINLVSGLGGSGYSQASPNFYACASTKSDDECRVDLSSAITVDNLLSGGGDAAEVVVESDVEYNGAAVEFCADGAGTAGGTYTVKVKGSTTLGTTKYYTSAAGGLSSALTVAEETEIIMSCGGMTTPLLAPATLGPDKTVNMVIYADPSGNVFAADNKGLANSNCTGVETLAVCTSLPSVFITVDTATPIIERYALTVTTKSEGVPYRNLLVKMLFNSSDGAIGATIQERYKNDLAPKALHTALFGMGTVTKNADGTYTFGNYTSEVIKNFKRGSDSGNQVLAAVTEVLTFDQAKIE